MTPTPCLPPSPQLLLPRPGCSLHLSQSQRDSRGCRLTASPAPGRRQAEGSHAIHFWRMNERIRERKKGSLLFIQLQCKLLALGPTWPGLEFSFQAHHPQIPCTFRLPGEGPLQPPAPARSAAHAAPVSACQHPSCPRPISSPCEFYNSVLVSHPHHQSRAQVSEHMSLPIRVGAPRSRACTSPLLWAFLSLVPLM